VQVKPDIQEKSCAVQDQKSKREKLTSKLKHGIRHLRHEKKTV